MREIDNKKIGNFIKNLRMEKHLTQEELANIVFTHRTSVTKWEKGRAIPLNDTLKALSNYFEVSVDEILAGERFPKEHRSEFSKEIILSLLSSKVRLTITLKRIILVLVFFIGTFLTYYFITNFNTLHVYRIGFISDKYASKDGILVTSKDKAYLKLGQIDNQSEKSKDITRIIIYSTKNNKKTTIYDGDPNNLFVDKRRYPLYFTAKNLNKKSNTYYITIYDENGELTLPLIITQDFSNDNLNVDQSFKDNNNYDKLSNLNFKKKFIYNQEAKLYTYQENNLYIECDFERSSCTFIETTLDYDEKYTYHFKSKDFVYRKKSKNKTDKYCFNTDKKITPEQDAFFRKFKENYWNKYINIVV